MIDFIRTFMFAAAAVSDHVSVALPVHENGSAVNSLASESAVTTVDAENPRPASQVILTPVKVASATCTVRVLPANKR
ncbi:MAG: hypothetical protein K2H18_03075 [Muribaculaceae bacterium]|nr:hypothetical protein [Muribaculaceae bacterium]